LLKDNKLESVLIEINPSRQEDKQIIETMQNKGFKYRKEQVESSKRKEGPHKGYAEYLFFR